MQIVSYEEVGQAAWDDFCAQSNDAWFLHTSNWLRYTLAYKPGNQSYSFAVVQNGLVQGICPLIAETADLFDRQFLQFSYAGEPCPMPALGNDINARQRKKILDCMTSHIDGLAFQHKVGRSSFRFNTLSDSYSTTYRGIPFNFLAQYGYLDHCMYSQVLSLSPDEKNILRSMRKGHRHNVTQAKKELEVDVFNWQNVSMKIFEQYKKLHAKAAGSQTRSESTFDMMYDWIKEKKSVLCGARSNGKYVGFALAFAYKTGGLYASACNDPEFVGNFTGQGIQWELICHLKAAGIQNYDLGLQFWGNQIHHIPDSKALSIANFKRGFGGITVPVFWGEKYYDSNLFELFYSNRVRAYKQSQFTNEGSTT